MVWWGREWEWGRTYECQFSVPWVFVFCAHDLVNVVAGGIAGWDLVVSFEDGDVGEAVAGEVEGCGEAEDTSADDGDGVGFGC